jgi:hypothetical protein
MDGQSFVARRFLPGQGQAFARTIINVQVLDGRAVQPDVAVVVAVTGQASDDFTAPLGPTSAWM